MKWTLLNATPLNAELESHFIMLILELKKSISEKFKNLDFVYDEAGKSISIFPTNPSIGDIVIVDDGDELLTYIGRFTHSHFSCYEEGFTENERNFWLSQKISALSLIISAAIPLPLHTSWHRGS